MGSVSARSIEAIVFDFDGVLRTWDVRQTHAIESKYDLPKGTVGTLAFEPELADRVVTGVISDRAWREEIAQRATRLYGEKGRYAVVEWAVRLGDIDHDVRRLIEGLKPTYRVALLSNATSRLDDDLRAHHIDNLFDVVFNTSSIGVAKPSPAVFQHVSETLALAPSQWLFIDDTEENVAAAEAYGVSAHHFRDLATLQAWITSTLSMA
jgi:putative hydrolase of the HAD superfamily